MLSASEEFRTKVANGGRVLARATLTLADGAVRELTGDDLMQGGMALDDSVSGGGSLQIGAAIANRITLTLNNSDGRFDDYDFTDSVAVPYAGMALDAGGVEWLRKGTFGIEQPDSYGGTIRLQGTDNMRLLDVPYSGVSTGYPASLYVIVTDICTHCGIELVSDFAGSSYVVPERPDDETLTCRAVVAFAAQTSGNWARMDEWGRLALSWYDLSAWEGTDPGDGVVRITAIGSLSVFTDDVVVTGVRVASVGDQGGVALSGSDGYVLDVADNQLVQAGEEDDVAAALYARVGGMRFRPLNVQALGDPTVEAGDPLLVVDRLGREYTSFATRCSWRLGSRETYACEADSPGRNRADGYSALTSTIVRQRNAIREERTAREAAIAGLAEEIATGSGLYETQEELADGSSVWYLHDKPTLGDSQVVMRLNAQALGLSTDGGVTYPYGFDVTGTAILERIYTIGIDATYITAGRVGDQANGSYIDFGLGDLVLGRTTQLGDTTLGDALDDARRFATDYLTYKDGKLTLGVAGSEIRNVITNERQAFETNAGDVMYFGRTGGIWKAFAPVIEVTDMLQFNSFVWIARNNGNMTLKWVG